MSLGIPRHILEEHVKTQKELSDLKQKVDSSVLLNKDRYEELMKKERICDDTLHELNELERFKKVILSYKRYIELIEKEEELDELKVTLTKDPPPTCVPAPYVIKQLEIKTTIPVKRHPKKEEEDSLEEIKTLFN